MEVTNTAASYSCLAAIPDTLVGRISPSQMVLLALAVAGLTIFLLSTRRRVSRSKRSSGTFAQDRFSATQPEHAAVRDVEAVMTELDQLARQIHGRLDTRLAKLEAVIHDADGRIDRLSRMLREADGRATVDITLDAELPQTTDPRVVASNDAPHAAVYRLADDGLSALDIAQETRRTPGEVELILSLRQGRGSFPPLGAISPGTHASETAPA